MRKILFLLFLGQFVLQAQVTIDNVQINYGSNIEKDANGDIVQILGEDDIQVVTLSLKGDDSFFVKTFTKDKLELIATTEVDFPKFKKEKVELVDGFKVGDNFYLFGESYDSGDKINRYLAYKISKKGVIDNEPIVLFENSVKNKKRKGNFYTRIAPNEDKILVLYYSYFPKEEEINYQVKLFDAGLNTLTDRSNSFAGLDKKRQYGIILEDFGIDYEGNIAFVIKETYKDKNTRQVNFYTNLYKKSTNYKEETITIDLHEAYPINTKLFGTSSGKFNIIGYYSPLNDNGKIKMGLDGVYNFQINTKTNAVSKINFNKFDLETKTKILGERKAKKDKLLEFTYPIKSLVERNDGGFYMISEYTTSYFSSAVGIGPLALNSYTFVSNEMIISSINPDGSLQWTNVLPKEQKVSLKSLYVNVGFFAGGVGFFADIPIHFRSKGPEFLSGLTFNKDHKLYVIINDNIDNKGVTDIDEIKDWGNYNKTVPSVFSFDMDGTMTRKDYTDEDTKIPKIKPSVNYRISNEDFIIYTSRRSENKLARVRVD